MKKILIPVSVVASRLLCTSGIETTGTISPDHLFLADNGKSLFVTNRAGSELLKMSSDGQNIEQRITFSSPVNAMTQDPSGKLWVVCDGNSGMMYELDRKKLSILSKQESGATPSDILYNPLSKSLWVTQRFNNELWEINPFNRKIINKIAIGREPVAMASFAGDSCLLIGNNLPEMASTAYPIAVQLDIVDVLSKKVESRIMLPNGSTDVKSIAMDKKRQYAYVTHLIARYQLPTNQLDRGWMATNTLSIIDLKAKKLLTSVLLDTPQKGAANPWAVIVTPDDKQIIVAASGSQELVRIDRIALHERLAKAKQGEMVTPSMKSWGNIPNDAGFLYGIRDFISTKGKGPRSVVATDNNIYTANYYTSELVSMDLNGKNVRTEVLGAPLAFTKVGKGDMYFHDATLCFQNWQSCATCHPNDARMDGLNWDLLNDGMGNPKNTKTLLLSHQTPPCMVTGIRKDAETAVRSGVKYILFGEGEEEVYEAIDEYLKSLKPLSSPYLQNGKLSKKAKKGKKIFEENCASCHSGEYYTDMKQYQVGWTTGPDKGLKMDVPALNECWRTAPYLYDGRCYSMKDMLKVHGPKKPVTDQELEELEEYILSL